MKPVIKSLLLNYTKDYVLIVLGMVKRYGQRRRYSQEEKVYNLIEYPLDESSPKAYPQKLCDYLTERYKIWPCSLLLDVGCGRGFYVRAFRRNRIIAIGMDSESVQEPTACPAWIVDIEKPWPLSDNLCDYVFCKSTLEHTREPLDVLKESYRVLKPNGTAIFLVPDWLSQWKNFYDDSTHRRPFTQKGLLQSLQLAGFRDVECENFYQLPFLWSRPWLRWIPPIVAILPDTTKYRAGKQNKLIRFSKERMLLASGVK